MPLSVGPPSALTQKAFYAIISAWIILTTTAPSFCGPVELLRNGNFREGFKEWRVEGIVFLDAESVKILGEGSLSQTVQRPDISFHLQLFYSVHTELPSKAYSARSVITFYTNDSKRRALSFTVIGQIHNETGISNWKDVKLDLFQLFRRSTADPESFNLTALKVTLELGSAVSVLPAATAYFKNVSLRRVNPTKILIQERERKILSGRTELVISATNAGDLDASNLTATLDLPPDTVIISEKSFSRRTLEAGASWTFSWMLTSKSSGTYSVTARVSSDQGEAELSLILPIVVAPQAMTTSASTDQIIVMFSQVAFLVLVAVLAMIIVIPMIHNRRDIEVVYRIEAVR